jgi:hypothetical protein
MGTRSLTLVYANNKPIINLYRQYDGYPAGHGSELAKFLNSIEEVTNGIRFGETRKTANGMGCLSAQLVAHFKTEVGGFYLTDVTQMDQGQDYEYHVHMDKVKVVSWNNRTIFEGSWKEFQEFCNKTEE